MPANTITPNPSGRPTIQELLRRNKEYSEATHLAPPKLPELMVALQNTPSVFIITCMDPRCDPDKFFQSVQPGEYLSLRNVGGRVASNIPDLVSLDSLLKFKTVLVIHHTDCGMTYASENQIRNSLRHSVSKNELGNLLLPTYLQSNSIKELQNDVQLLRQSSFLRQELKENVAGLVYNVEDGRLTQVC